MLPFWAARGAVVETYALLPHQWPPRYSDLQAVVCRTVWPDCVLLLCIYHVQVAWIDQIKSKLVVQRQDLAMQVFQDMRNLMHMHASGGIAEVQKQAEDAFEAVMVRYRSAEDALVHYFETTWGCILGAQLSEVELQLSMSPHRVTGC